MDGSLPAVLRRGRARLAPVAAHAAAAARALDRLDRDLLPRTAGGDAYLVAGIVGPNNAGKSALFNALVGRPLSPSVPAGGATRRLVGAAHPDLLARLRAEPTLARFRLLPFGTGAAGAEAILQPAADPAELLVAADDALPAGLMLIDTPDFDSILEDNRLASESLLAVADLVVAVVTRHSYQNREVVRFLERWFEHGRPWMLVYNEATDATVAHAHAAKLAADLGTPPLAVFWAPHSMEVQAGVAPLEPRALSPRGPDGQGALLRDVLFDFDRIAEVKSRSFSASLGHLRADLTSAAAELWATSGQADDLLLAAEARAARTGREIASAAMPVGPFLDAFRTVLDRRSNPLSRGWRASVRRIRLTLERAVSALRPGRVPAPAAPPDGVSLTGIEHRELERVWPDFWEGLARDLGPEARHTARQVCSPATAAMLDADLADGQAAPALERARQALAHAPAGFDDFERACEQLVDHAIEERGFDLDIQTAADLATVAPLAIAAAIIIKTGGVGADIAIAGGGAVSAFLAEKYAHLLGSGITASARRRWTELRAGAVAQLLVEAVLVRTAPALRATTARAARDAEALRAFEVELT